MGSHVNISDGNHIVQQISNEHALKNGENAVQKQNSKYMMENHSAAPPAKRQKIVGQKCSNLKVHQSLPQQSQQQLKEQALLRASSTIAAKHNDNRINKEQKRLQKRIAALNCANIAKDQQKAIAIDYVKRSRKVLLADHKEIFHSLVTELKSFKETPQNPEELCLRVCELLKDFPSLKDAFVVFLKPHQALKIGMFSEYCSQMAFLEFSNKLQHEFSEQPAQVQRIVKAVQSLMKVENVSWEEVKSAMTQHLRHPHLLDSLSRCFAQAKPVQSLSADFEHVDLENDVFADGMETINLLDSDSSELSCTCSQAAHNHVPLKFIDGRVHVQQGKSLRPAKVTYFFDAKLQSTPLQVETKSRRPKSSKSIVKSTQSSIPNSIGRKTLAT